jgi:hypothetical protein
MPCDHLEHRVRAIACVELSENVRHVILDRADGDAEVSSDLLVGIPTAHEPQDRCLLLRQPHCDESSCLCTHPHRRSRLEDSLATNGRLEYLFECLGLSVLQKITCRPRADAFLERSRIIKGRQQDDRNEITSLTQGLERADTRSTWHADVGEHRIDLVTREGIQETVAVVGLHDDFDSAERLEKCFQAVADQRLIIRQGDSQHAALGSGSTARRTQPRGVRRSSETIPWNSSSRSRNPRRPFPAGGVGGE